VRGEKKMTTITGIVLCKSLWWIIPLIGGAVVTAISEAREVE